MTAQAGHRRGVGGRPRPRGLGEDELQIAQACLEKPGLRDREVHPPEAAEALVVAGWASRSQAARKRSRQAAQGGRVVGGDVVEPDLRACR